MAEDGIKRIPSVVMLLPVNRADDAERVLNEAKVPFAMIYTADFKQPKEDDDG